MYAFGLAACLPGQMHMGDLTKALLLFGAVYTILKVVKNGWCRRCTGSFFGSTAPKIKHDNKGVHMASIQKPVMVSIQGIQTIPEQAGDETKLLVRGQFSKEDGASLISYAEQDETYGQVNTKIELHKDYVSVSRSGAFMSNLVFRKGVECKSVFETPFGRFNMSAFSTDVDVKLDETEGKIFLAYELSFQGEPLGLNRINIHFWDHA